jgi:ADP-ribose pyrophosphatase YjhB (NUDIX family)
VTDDVPRIFVVTSAIVRRGAEVLLVEQAADSGEVGWSLPGGTAEAHEDVTHALAREVAAETGLRVVAHHGLAYAVQYVRPAEITLAFVFDVAADGTVEPADPDVLAARYFPVAEAIERLRRVPLKVMTEPAVAYLSGAEEPGAYWTYGDVAGRAEVTARIPGRPMR